MSPNASADRTVLIPHRFEDTSIIAVGAEWTPRLTSEWGEKAARHLHFQDGIVLVALEGDLMVGLLSAYTRGLPPPLEDTSETYIDFLEVRNGYRRRGIASALVASVIKHARDLGHHQVRAWSSEDKLEAIPMWRRLSFGLCPAVTHPAAAGGREVRGFFAAMPLTGNAGLSGGAQ